MSIKDRIREKLSLKLTINKLEIEDDSAKHAGHSGSREGGETHFNIKVVSPDFIGKNKVARHKLVYDALKDEMKERIHALSIKALAPEE